jgi:large subunit ribosomal protein L6
VRRLAAATGTPHTARRTLDWRSAMSRVGRQPIPLAQGVTISVDDERVTVTGPKGTLSRPQLPGIQVIQEDGRLVISRENDEKHQRSMHGLMRTLVANMVTGVSSGFTKTLEIQGVGYRAQKQGNNLVLALGFSHPVEVSPPPGIELNVEGTNRILVTGIDKELVGQVAANIRKIRPPEPYKGKGIRYQGEVVRRKAGKTGKGGKK